MHDRLWRAAPIDFQLDRHVVDEVGVLMIDVIFHATALEEPPPEMRP